MSCPQAWGRRSGLLSHRQLHALGRRALVGTDWGPLLSPGHRVGLVLMDHPLSADSLSQIGISRHGSGFSLLVGAHPGAEL